jgi:hypothetical protein
MIAWSRIDALGVVRANEYAGATFEIDDTYREITHHPEGRWATAGVRTVFHLDAVDAGDAASATGRLVPRQALLVLPISARYSGVKITQIAPDSDNPAPFEGYWMAGRVLVGAVYPLADDPSWGRAVEHQGGAELERTRDRTTRARNAAPIARVIELAWVDGVDQSGVDGGDPDRVEYGGASASVGGTPSAADRFLATRFGVKSMDLVLAKKFGYMASLKGTDVTEVPIQDAVGTLKTVDSKLYELAKTFFG